MKFFAPIESASVLSKVKIARGVGAGVPGGTGGEGGAGGNGGGEGGGDKLSATLV